MATNIVFRIGVLCFLSAAIYPMALFTTLLIDHCCYMEQLRWELAMGSRRTLAVQVLNDFSAASVWALLWLFYMLCLLALNTLLTNRKLTVVAVSLPAASLLLALLLSYPLLVSAMLVWASLLSYFYFCRCET